VFDEMPERAFIHIFRRLTYAERWGQFASVGEGMAEFGTRK